MVSIFQAEWQKASGNRLATIALIWVFPILVLILSGLALVGVLLSVEFRARASLVSLSWPILMVSTWSFANNSIAQLAVLGFSAFVFAGEYQWNTWKNIIPRCERTRLILTKFVTLGLLVVTSLAAMTVIAAVGAGLVITVAGGQFGPPLTLDVLAEFADDYFLQGVLTFMSSLIAAGYAAIAAIYTRSVAAGALLGFLFTIAETSLLLPLRLLSNMLANSHLPTFYQLTPTFNLSNIGSWLVYQKGYELPQLPAPPALGISILIVALWIVGLVGLAVYLFRRQDILN